MLFLSRIITVCLLAGLVAEQANAEVSIDRREMERFGDGFFVMISGEITNDDYQLLLATRGEVSEKIMRVAVLTSRGGDINAAMAIGRYLRAEEFDVIVPSNAVCYSACVFLLASGIYKTVDGQVGIHRPYFISKGSGLISKAIKATKAEIEAYLEEMNIPSRLAEDMFSIDPANMRILSASALRDYRLNSKDFVAQENDTIEMIDQLGMSRTAYEAYRQDLNYSCEIFKYQREKMIACIRQVAARHNIPLPPEKAQEN